MTRITKAYRVRVATAGATDVEGHVDFTLDTQLGDIPQLSSPQVRPTEGRTESLAVRISVLDKANVISSRLGDAGGRLNLTGRLCDVQLSQDGGAWTTLVTARLVNMAESASRVGVFDLDMGDERWLERRTRIWTNGDTTSLHPGGLRSDATYRGFGITVGRWVAGSQKTVGAITYTQIVPMDGNIHTEIADYAKADVAEARVQLGQASSVGNYRTLRFLREDGVLFPIQTGESYINPDGTDAWPGTGVGYFGLGSAIWLIGDVLPGDSDVFRGQLVVDAYEASDRTPIHVGGISGIRPFQLVKNAFDGLYGDGTVLRYDPTAVQALIDDPIFGVGWWRITAVDNVAAWLETNIYQPYGVVPFIDAQGRIAPRKILLPQNVNPDSLFTFNDSNSRTPDWEERGREIVTRITYTYLDETAADPNKDATGLAFDRINTVEKTLVREHDRSTILGGEVHVELSGLHVAASGEEGVGVGLSASALADRFARETFDRVGDGPQYGSTMGMDAAKVVAVGDWVRVQNSTYPNPALNARGGTRLVQVVRREPRAEGYYIEWLDGGPSLQPLSTPSLSVAAETGNSLNGITATVSGPIAGDSWVLEAAASVSQPPANSSLWRVIGEKKVVSTPADLSITVSTLPSGTNLWFRAIRAAAGRIRSNYSTAVQRATATMDPVTNFQATPINAADVDLIWSVAYPDRVVDLLLDLGSGSAPVTPYLLLPMGTEGWRITGLSGSTAYRAGARVRDRFGGVSVVATGAWDDFTTGAVLATCPAPRDLIVLYDGS